jgi:hypothetical protein
VPFFGGGSRRVFGGATFVLMDAGGLPFLRCHGCGAPSGDKRNARHGDPIPLRHELGQGWSAAEPNPETVVGTLLKSRPYLRNNEGKCVKVLTRMYF